MNFRCTIDMESDSILFFPYPQFGAWASCFVCWFHPYVFRWSEPHTRETIFVWSMVVGTLRVSSEGWRVLLQILLVDTMILGMGCMGTKHRGLAESILSSVEPHTIFPHKWVPSLFLAHSEVIDTFEWIFVLWYCVLHTILPIIAFYYILIYCYLCAAVLGSPVLLYFHTGDQVLYFFSHYYDYLFSFECLFSAICELNAIGLQPRKNTHFQIIITYHFIAERRNWEIRWLRYPSIYHQ